ncbi:MAG: class I SAM-dependent rRNA methyltransferase [Elusimicrobia bacterium]|nr:class I SAM-dependent rRNA methyltransferase [Elusimicrobiota bacterium]
MKPSSAESQERSALPSLRLKPREEGRLLSGHPWVFSNELETVGRELPVGSLARLESSQGRNLGLGFYNPHSLIAWRFLAPRPEPVDASFFKKRLSAALELRMRYYPGQRSYRLCFGESDGLPGLILDKYEDFVVAQVLSAGMERCLGSVEGALRELLQPKGAYLQNDHPSRKLEGLELERRLWWGEVPPRIVIEERGLRFLKPLIEGQKTGFYFDQRDNRQETARWARGRRVLDLFCYTGAFAVSAAQAGAEQVLGLDSSAAAIELARENSRRNGLEERCRFDTGDAEEVLEVFSQGRQPLQPNFILLDPPSFVPAKRHLPKALRAYVKLNALALRCLDSGGLLATSTCSHHVGREAFLLMIRQAASKAERRVRLLRLGTQSLDHPILLSMPETEYLHFALLEVI